MDFSFLAIIQRHASEMETAFRSIIETIIRNSSLSIFLLRISNVTEDSFHVSLEARIAKTGPATASISPMTVDLCGPAGHFGNITLPAIKTQAYGTDVVVASQLVNIVDKEALKAFIQTIIQEGGAVLSLRNGRTAIAALGFGPRDVTYEKDIALPGMKGPAVNVCAATNIRNHDATVTELITSSTAPLNASPAIAGISKIDGPAGGIVVTITFQVANPSPLEISFGMCHFEILDNEGRPISELKGRLDIRRNHFETTFQGNVNEKLAAELATRIREAASNESRGSKSEKEDGEKQKPEARLVGRRCASAGWCEEAIQSINVPLIGMQKLFHVLGLDDGSKEVEKKGGVFTSWTNKLMTR